jgi:hypothetical protein
LQKLPLALKGTTVKDLVRPEEWSDQIRVSGDFRRVIKEDNRSLDQYLRSPNWIVSYCRDSDTTSIKFLIISPFEANELIPRFRCEKLVTQLRMFAARLHETQDLLLYTPELWIPPSITPSIPSLIRLLNCELLDAEILIFSGTISFLENERCSLGLDPDQKHVSHNQNSPVEHECTSLKTTSARSKSCRFAENTRELAKRIVELRFGPIPRLSFIDAPSIFDADQIYETQKRVKSLVIF